MIYLDNAGTTKIAPEVLDEMMPYLTEEYGNPGSLHTFGSRARDAVDLARQRVANAIGAEPQEIIFTSGGSEANNLAVKFSSEFFGNGMAISSYTEHDSMKRALENYFQEVRWLDYYYPSEICNQIQIESLRDVSAVSFMYVNNELGFVNPVKEICKCLNTCATSIVDAVQALGNHEINVKDIDCDFLSMSSHKIHGPKGVGALYIHKDLMKDYFKPLIFGGSNQEFGLRGGTENVAGIVGFGKACEMIDIDKNKSVISKLRRRFIDSLKQAMGKHEFRVNFDIEDSKIVSLTIPGIDSETLVLLLSSQEVYISAGSACKSLESKPNEVLLASYLTPDEARNTVRISLSCYNTLEEMDKAAKVIGDFVDILL